MKRLLILALLALAAVSLPARTLTPADSAAIRDVGDPQISPDGQWVAYTVRISSLDDDKNRTHLWISSWDGAESRQLTFSKESESGPRWSPDGKVIAFRSSRGVEHAGSQLWLMNRGGGEGEKITDFKGSVGDYAWSPDGKKIAMIVEDPDPDSATSEADEKKTKPPIVIDRYHFKEDNTGYLTSTRQHLYLFDVASRKSEPLTPGNFNESSPSWSPDGKEIAFSSNRTEDPDRNDNNDLYVIAASAGATPRKLTTNPGDDADSGWGSAAWSPDGKWIAYVVGGPAELISYAMREIAVIPADGGTPRIVTPKLDRKVQKLHWAADGKSLSFVMEDDRTMSLRRVAVDSGAITVIAGGKREITDYSVAANGRTALLSSDDLHPAEIFTLDAAPVRDGNARSRAKQTSAIAEPRQLTTQNAEFLSQITLGAVEEIEFPSKDGTIIHGFVATPPGYVAGQRYPTLLRIHGGPVLEFGHRFSFEWQLFAANGYVVVGANPRGSSGRGEAFAKAIWADWGHKDAEDVLAAVDYVVARGLADPTHLGVGGWSYGGMLTNYVIAQDHRFLAATSGASMSNILAGYGTDQYTRDYEIELGTPWEHPEVWTRISFPFLHADRIKTPTLFLGGDKDFNVPLLNGEQMYQALRSLGIPTELVIYPGQYHGISKASYVKDRYQRYLDWYAKYMK